MATPGLPNIGFVLLALSLKFLRAAIPGFQLMLFRGFNLFRLPLPVRFSTGDHANCHRQHSLSAVQPRRIHMSTSSLGLPLLPLVSRLGDSCFCVGILGCCFAACSGGLALLPASRCGFAFGGCTAALCGPATGPDSRDTRNCLLPAMQNCGQLLGIHASMMRLRPGYYLPWPPLAPLPLLPAATLQPALALQPFSSV